MQQKCQLLIIIAISYLKWLQMIIKFRSITEIWLGGDHYKWRAVRTNGINEKFCTGEDTTEWEKFEKWVETVPYTMRNPPYHWTYLELKTAFGINKILKFQNRS